MFITDDFLAYQVKTIELRRDVIYVCCIYKSPQGRIGVDMIEH
ncbi:MAG: hypothetical protein ACTSQP_19715 [Promethearchaeota archaeon]